MALMALWAQRRVNFDVAVFANVGVKSENPETLRYFHEVALPYAEKHGLPLVEVAKQNRKKQPIDLYDVLISDRRSIEIPIYMSGGAPGRRNCTTHHKIKQVDRYIRQQKPRPTHAVVSLGISIDEIERAKDELWTDKEPGKKGKKLGFWKRRAHPLLDLRLSLSDCVQIILNAGLPLPPKSSCWYCPFRSPSAWVEMRRENPEQFTKAVALENRINEKRAAMGKDRVYLHRNCVPLEQAVGHQTQMFADDMFDECGGVCHT